jgi:hypothetical protein
LEHTLVSVYLTHLLLQLQLAELDYRGAERVDAPTSDAADIVDRRGEQMIKCMKSVCAGGKAVLIHMNGRNELPHFVRSVDSIDDRHRLLYRPLDNEALTLECCDMMLASSVEVPILGRPDSKFLREAAIHGMNDDEG